MVVRVTCGSEGGGCGSNHNVQFGMYTHICAISMSPSSVSC